MNSKELAHEEQARVWVVDDEAGIREMLGLMLTSAGYQCQSFANAADFLAHFDDQAVDCIVLDIRMPGMSGTLLQQKLQEQKVTVPVVFISGHGDIAMAVEAIKNGAFDFIEKPFREETLLTKVGEAVNSYRNLQIEQRHKLEIAERLEKLTPREREVMALVVDGKPNKVAAAELGIAPGTVEIHRSRLMGKMEAASVPELMKMLMALEQLQ